jgi:hypothetical protein
MHPAVALINRSGVNDIVAGDWNGDGKLDLAIATFAASSGFAASATGRSTIRARSLSRVNG